MTWGTWPCFQSSVEKYYLILECSIFETGHDLLARRYVCTAAGGEEDITNDHTNCKDRLASLYAKAKNKCDHKNTFLIKVSRMTTCIFGQDGFTQR